MTEPMCYIFGYGSLINPQSIAKTLQEHLEDSSVEPTVLRDYERSWSIEDQVFIEGDTRREITMVFLNIKASKGAKCNGVVFPVNEKQLLDFDKRERRYNRVDVGHLVNPRKDIPVYTYVGKEPYITPPDTAFVADIYEKIVEDGLALRGESFRSEYLATTVPHSFNRVSEAYTF